MKLHYVTSFQTKVQPPSIAHSSRYRVKKYLLGTWERMEMLQVIVVLKRQALKFLASEKVRDLLVHDN